MTNTNIIKDFFEGKIKLWNSFWIAGELIYGFLLLVLLQLYKYLFSELSERSNYLSILNLNNLSFISKLFLISITIFISIGVWKAAENYKGSIIWIVLTFIIVAYRCYSLRLIFFI